MCGGSEAVERKSERMDTAYSPRLHEEELSATAERILFRVVGMWLPKIAGIDIRRPRRFEVVLRAAKEIIGVGDSPSETAFFWRVAERGMVFMAVGADMGRTE